MTSAASDNALDFFRRKTGSRRDAHLLFAASCFVRGRNRDDAVGVDFERNFDLRNATRRRRNADQFEFPEAAVAVAIFALALQDVDLDRRLIIDNGRKGQTVAQRNRRVALDNFGEQTAACFQAQG